MTEQIVVAISCPLLVSKPLTPPAPARLWAITISRRQQWKLQTNNNNDRDSNCCCCCCFYFSCCLSCNFLTHTHTRRERLLTHTWTRGTGGRTCGLHVNARVWHSLNLNCRQKENKKKTQRKMYNFSMKTVWKTQRKHKLHSQLNGTDRAESTSRLHNTLSNN